jgi:hypothetical protein
LRKDENNFGKSQEEMFDLYIQWFRKTATALKKTDPHVKILAHGLTAGFYYTKWSMKNKRARARAKPVDQYIPKFLNECGDLLDMLTVHRYPGIFQDFDDQSMAYTTAWDSIVPQCKAWIMKYCEGKWGREPGEVKFGVSEWSFANHDQQKSKFELGTFWQTSIWCSDILGRFMKNDVHFGAYWSVSNGYHGMLRVKGDKIIPNPFFHTFKFMREASHIDSEGGSQLVHVEGDTEVVSVYPIRYQNHKLSVIVINKHRNEDVKLHFLHRPEMSNSATRQVLLRDGTRRAHVVPLGNNGYEIKCEPLEVSCLDFELVL